MKTTDNMKMRNALDAAKVRVSDMVHLSLCDDPCGWFSKKDLWLFDVPSTETVDPALGAALRKAVEAAEVEDPQVEAEVVLTSILAEEGFTGFLWDLTLCPQHKETLMHVVFGFVHGQTLEEACKKALQWGEVVERMHAALNARPVSDLLIDAVSKDLSAAAAQAIRDLLQKNSEYITVGDLLEAMSNVCQPFFDTISIDSDIYETIDNLYRHLFQETRC